MLKGSGIVRYSGYRPFGKGKGLSNLRKAKKQKRLLIEKNKKLKKEAEAKAREEFWEDFENFY